MNAKWICRGWTLLELLVVLVIMGVMVGSVVWRMSSWMASQQRQQFLSLSATWKKIVSTAMTRGMNVSCHLLDRGWQCWSWEASLSGQADWVALSSFPWVGKASWSSHWHWHDSSPFTIWSDGRHEPQDIVLCHSQKKVCWSVLAEKKVSL